MYIKNIPLNSTNEKLTEIKEIIMTKCTVTMGDFNLPLTITGRRS